jgi:hypothetical protein
MKEVLSMFNRSSSLPGSAEEIQTGISTSSFLIALNCQIKEPVLDDLNFLVAH